MAYAYARDGDTAGTFFGGDVGASRELTVAEEVVGCPGFACFRKLWFEFF